MEDLHLALRLPHPTRPPQMLTPRPAPALAHLQVPKQAPRNHLPRADPPPRACSGSCPQPAPSCCLEQYDGDRTGRGPRWSCLPHRLVHVGRDRSGDLALAPPQSLTREKLPLSGQPAGTAFPPGEMPTEEFALHSLTPALIIGIKSASLFHKSRELIPCSPFSARGL